ncbi:MAG: hypothetical protein ACFUZC_14345 [Chthoniobacteraceae bacterium]
MFSLGSGAAHAADGRSILHREGWSFDRSDIEWYDPAKTGEQEKNGTLNALAGWTEYDFALPAGGWNELWAKDGTLEWGRDIYLDGKQVYNLVTSTPDDVDLASPKKAWWKVANFHLSPGKHSLRFRRLNYPGTLPSAWELRAADGDPAGCIRVTDTGNNIVRAGTKAKVVVAGGDGPARHYELVLRNDVSKEILPAATVDFPASSTLVEKTVTLDFATQGVFSLLARVDGKLLRPADLKGGQYIVIDTKAQASGTGVLQTKSIIDIDCTATPPKEGYWEKDGDTRIIKTAFGSYRESSGRGTGENWGTDGFSYRFDLPDTDHIYRLRVDYPDDDRRSMGFWINDGTPKSNANGIIGTGGVETGDRYLLTHKMLTHEAFFYPRAAKDLIVAVLNLGPGMKAGASRIRIDRVESALPSAPLGRIGGRVTGSYFEEPGRWIKFFGGEGDDPREHVKTMERWGQWNRYLGANMMFPTINVYQGNHYPSQILEGYFNRSFNEVRILALMGEKYGQKVVPEFSISGQKWFDKHVMGVAVETHKVNGKDTAEVTYLSKEAEETVLRNRDGAVRYSFQPFLYNVLHPKVQAMYLSVLGELADTLGDCESFEGISSRQMLTWAWQGWNALPNLNWGYDDWTVAQFEKETGIKVPGDPGDPARFRQRFNNLTGENRERWIQWRCAKVFAFHCRLRDRIQKAKPTAKLFLTYYEPDRRAVYSPDILGQMREVGMDAKLYEREPGIVFMPSAFYGRRFSTPVADAIKSEPLFDPEVGEAARLGDRGMVLYSDYYEVNAHLDWSKLGGKPYAAFDACEPSGLNEREMYALALANSDVSYLLNGGSGWIFGTPEVMQPFLREYRALPAVPFKAFAAAKDPVAVWQHEATDQTLWFYAVNRLPVPVKVELALGGASPKAVSVVDGQAVEINGGKIAFTLEPFMLRTFQATGASLSGCRAEVPVDYVEKLKPAIAFAQQLRDDLLARRVVPELSENETREAVQYLDEAREAFGKGEYWRARGAMHRHSLVKVYSASGCFPPGLFERSQPLGIPSMARAPQNAAATAAQGHLKSVFDLAYDAEGNLWANGGDRLFLSRGGSFKTLMLYAPYVFDRGDIRYPTLLAPSLFAAGRIGLLPGQVVAQQGDGPPILFNAASGRSIKQQNGFGYIVPGASFRLLNTTVDEGDVLIYSSTPGFAGVYRTDAAGKACRKLSDIVALDAASDVAGQIYLLDAGGITLIGKEGQVLSRLGEKGISRIAVSRDGRLLAALKDNGSAVSVYQRGMDGSLAKRWAQPLPARATSLAISPGNTLAVGYAQETNGAVAEEYTIKETGMQLKHDIVPALEAVANQSLSDFTQLKVWNGGLYYSAHGKLMRVTPGTPDKTEVAFDPKLSAGRGAFDAFAWAPNGDLYLLSQWNGSRHGANLYLCKKNGETWSTPKDLNEGKPLIEGQTKAVADLAVNAQGRLILRCANPDAARKSNVTLYRWTPGEKPEELLDLGLPEGGSGDYGLHQAADGHLLVAGGNTRTIASLAPDGTPLWQIHRPRTSPPGYVDLREPLGITQDSRGAIWVSDPARHQIIRFDASGRMQRAFGSFGTADLPNHTILNNPAGVAAITDSAGKEWLYVADVGNQRLVKLALDEMKQ